MTTPAGSPEEPAPLKPLPPASTAAQRRRYRQHDAPLPSSESPPAPDVEEPPPVVVQPSRSNYVARAWNSVPRQNPVANLPDRLPMFLRNRAIVFNAWAIAMIAVCFDEWHNLGILPRPSRLWDTSLLYGVLAVAGVVDEAVPLVNALAIGYAIVVVWQYFNGNLTPAGGAAPATPAATATNPTIASSSALNSFVNSTVNALSVVSTPPTPNAQAPYNTAVTGQGQ